MFGSNFKNQLVDQLQLNASKARYLELLSVWTVHKLYDMIIFYPIFISSFPMWRIITFCKLPSPLDDASYKKVLKPNLIIWIFHQSLFKLTIQNLNFLKL